MNRSASCLMLVKGNSALHLLFEQNCFTLCQFFIINFSMNGSLNTYCHHLFWFWKFFLQRKLVDDLGKLMKGHLLIYNKLKLKCYKLHKLEMHCTKLVIISNIMRQEPWRNRITIKNYKSVHMIDVYVEIAKNTSLFLSVSVFSKVMFKISRKLNCLGGLFIIPTVIDVVLGNRISKKMPLITFGKTTFSS